LGLRKFRKFSNPHPIFDLSIIKCFIWKMPPKKQQIIPDVSASQNQDPVNIILKSIPSKYNIKINRETHIFHEHRVKQAKSSTIQAQPTVVTVH
jgi:hypothetical protein